MCSCRKPPWHSGTHQWETPAKSQAHWAHTLPQIPDSFLWFVLCGCSGPLPFLSKQPRKAPAVLPWSPFSCGEFLLFYSMSFSVVPLTAVFCSLCLLRAPLAFTLFLGLHLERLSHSQLVFKHSSASPDTHFSFYLMRRCWLVPFCESHDSVSCLHLQKPSNHVSVLKRKMGKSKILSSCRKMPQESTWMSRNFSYETEIRIKYRGGKLACRAVCLPSD